MNGFVLVDKPTNILSHDLTSRIGRLFGVRAGHAGTLDPNVGGVMVVGLGKYTRLLRFFTRLDKTYVCLLKMDDNIDQNHLNILRSKVGENVQKPPPQSAVAKRPRVRRLYELEILEVFHNRILFRARVESGFYMRVLCDDVGGEMEDLRRTKIGNIDENMTVNVYRLFYHPDRVHIYNAEEMFRFLKMDRLDVDQEMYRKISHGNRVDLDLKDYTGIFYRDRLIAIMNRDSDYEVVLV
ncbi:MAG: hypothetical protein NZ908_01990 [Candidatus Micrarchaeota archaeon]|nr:hypothetical protein [Candidatus Micrarchaeota archaeon]MCX8154536.1 hypothetical protein [Candidatus Micrarchaeota archaeon]